MGRTRLTLAAQLFVVTGLLAEPALDGSLDAKRFSAPELYVPTSNVELGSGSEGLPARAAWDRFLKEYGSGTRVFVDPRSGTATGVVLRFPLIPGTGRGNRVGLDEIGRKLARPVQRIDTGIVGELVRRFIVKNREAIGIDVAQLGAPLAARVTDELWQVSIPQEVEGIRVRGGRIAATLSHGNLVLLGTERWANVALDAKPRLTGDEAVAAGFAYTGGKTPRDRVIAAPSLAIVPVAAASGNGYGHRLVWAFEVERRGELGRFEALVDAHDGTILSFDDTNVYETRRIKGGVYPSTNTGACPSRDRCGILEAGWPMPFADTGMAPPDDYTNGAGLYEAPDGAVATTTLNGRYVRVLDECGPVLETSATGALDLGGYDGQHDCVTSGSSPGNTAASRTTYYHLNRMREFGKGWLPTNPWLDAPITGNVNLNVSCTAFYSAGTGEVYFVRGDSVCLNTGENASVIGHEWGHALDDNDAIGNLSRTTEAYADIAGQLMLQGSCNGYGFRTGLNHGCGVTADGTGNNVDESQFAGVQHCALDCSGRRELDWDRQADHLPATPQNFSCVYCDSGSGPCGREGHCDGHPSTEAAWDLATRDLAAPPFLLGRRDGFIAATRIFFQGSGNIGDWHACSCAGGTADGCGATNAYMQWLAADDDDGDLESTPHMTALHAAFSRHGIACAEIMPANGGCAGGPVTAPDLVVTAGGNRVDLSWTAVPGATRYRVLRTEGSPDCNLGMAVIAETTSLGHADTGLANGRAYHYAVHAVGASGSCFGPSSDCRPATPVQCAGLLSLSRGLFLCDDTVGVALEDLDLRGAGSQAVSVASSSETTPETVLLVEAPAASGRFTGTIATTDAAAASDDGAVSVAHGDTITVRYVDASYCGTPLVPVERTARALCRGPEVTNVRATDIHGTRAVIRWDTDERSDSRVVHGTVLPPNVSVGPDAALVTSHAVEIGGLEECSRHYFSVESTDPLGNRTLDDGGGSYYSFDTPVETNPNPASTSPPVAIPPGDPWIGGAATIVMTRAEVVQDLNVKVGIAHWNVTNLVLSLVGPDHRTVVLANRRGGGEDFDGTVFDDDAPLPVSQGTAPFTGSFRPDEPLSAFDGTLAAGTWTLRVIDYGSFEPGTIERFELEFVFPPRLCGPSVGLDSSALGDACTGAGAGSGNGVVDPGETIEVSVRVKNQDADPATDLSARLSSYTPGVFVTTDTSRFPDLAPGASALGDVPYALYVDSGVACGTMAVLRLNGASSEGGWADAFAVRIGAPATVTTTYENNTPKAIPDLATTRSWIVVPDSGFVTDVDVGASISHLSARDLDIFLVGPGIEGERVELSTDNGGLDGQNYTNTIFDDEAAVSIVGASAPMTGRYRPETPLPVLDGIPVEGTWTLELTDDHVALPGTLLRWSIDLTRLAGYACSACTVAEPPLEVASLWWSGTGKDALAWSAAPRAASYVLHRGTGADLPGLLGSGIDSCERLTTAATSSGPVLSENPPAGSLSWHLIRGGNTYGVGPSGTATAGPRILDSSGACP